MNLNREHLDRIRRISRAERIRAIWAAEEIHPDGEKEPSLSEDQYLAGAAWHQLMAREQVQMFPADRDQKPPVARPAIRKLNWNVLTPALSAAAVLAIALAVFTINPGVLAPGGATVLYKTTLDAESLSATEALFAPAALKVPGGVVEIFDGFVLIEPGPESSQDLYAVVLRARFAFQQPVNLRLHHPFATLKVTGTRFTVDFSAGYGSFTVEEGSVEFEHHPRGATANISRTVSGPGHMVFDANFATGTTLRTVAAQPEGDSGDSAASESAQAVWQEFLLKDGTKIVGRVLYGSRDVLHVQTRNGEFREIPRNNLKRTRMIQ